MCPREESIESARGARSGPGRLPLAFAVAALSLAALADASAQSVSPNVMPRVSPPKVTPSLPPPRINIPPPPRVHINTPRVNTPGYGVNPGYGKPVIVRRPSYVVPQDEDSDPSPRRGKKVAKQPPKEPPPRDQQTGPAGRGSPGLPPAEERRFVADEVVIEIAGSPSQQTVEALARRHRLNRLESQRLASLSSTWFRWQIPDGRSVREVVRLLAADPAVQSVQPNYQFKTTQELEPAGQGTSGDPAQYMIGKLRLPQAHSLARGEKVLIAVIDSGIDDTHPELKDAVVGAFDALDTPEKAHTHGTAIAGAIAAQARLMGVAPRAHILGVRAFGATSDGADSTTFRINKGLDWAIQQGVRVINMSFAGPRQDPAMARMLAAAHAKGIVLIAAAGNAGPKSPPLYPAADPNVIAVTATDLDDRLFPASNRGRHIAVAAPGVDILVPAPEVKYQLISGTSFAAAHVSGVAALMLERKPDLTPDAVRKILLSTAKDLGPKGRDDQFGAGLTDAFQAISTVEPAKFQASGAAAR
jgi:subtilisin family serine protease